MKNIITAEWLKVHKKNKNLVIIDCRFDMANPEWGPAEYAKAHVKKAVYVNLEKDMTGTVGEHGGRHPLPDLNEFADKMKALGIGDNKAIVIYDDGGYPMASRLWFMLKYIGLNDVRIIDGGFDACKEKGIAITNAQTILKPAKQLTVRLRDEMICDVDHVRATINEEKSVLIDSRANPRYSGLEEPFDKIAGHIPNAQNYFWQETLIEGKMADKEFLEKKFEALENYDEVIVHCGSGITGCVNMIAMEEAGIDSKLYLGSFSDWVSYEENEVITKAK